MSTEGENVRHKRLAVPLAIAVAVALVCIVAVRWLRPAPPSANAGGAPFTYTNAITGKVAEDKPAEIGQQTPVPLPIQPAATIFGVQQLYNNNLTSTQADSLQVILDKFLLAHSGLADITAGIQNGAVNEPDSQTMQFTLVMVRPEVTYQVTAYVANQFQTTPDVTFKQISEVQQ